MSEGLIFWGVGGGSAAEPKLSPSPPRVLRLEPGGAATLRCGSRGAPAPLVAWALRGNRTLLLPGQRLDRLSVSQEGAVSVLTLEVGTQKHVKKN